MKCKNCGAELNNGRCEYCGSVFSEDMKLFTLKTPQIDEDLFKKVLRESQIVLNPPKERIEVTCLGDKEPRYIEGV